MYIPFSDLVKSLATDWQNFACRAVGAVNVHFAQHILKEHPMYFMIKNALNLIA